MEDHSLIGLTALGLLCLDLQLAHELVEAAIWLEPALSTLRVRYVFIEWYLVLSEVTRREFEQPEESPWQVLYVCMALSYQISVPLWR